MNKWLFPVVWVLAVSLCAVAEELPPSSSALLDQVRAKMMTNLSRLPNYTCLQTIARKVRHAPSRRYELVDTIRLEVALVEGKELFAWPGEGKFEDKEISQIVTGGAIGNGTFALHAKSIFQSHSARIKFAGEVMKDNKPRLQWDYDVPQRQSGYILRVGSREAAVGYHGSFWADPGTLDLTRLEVEADEIPPELHLARAADAVDYKRTPIGSQTFLLPQTAELSMIDGGNSESINRTQFSSCRQYMGESVLSFADPAPDASTPASAAKSIELPAGLLLEASLDTPIASGSSAVGDPVTAVLRKALRKHGVEIAPKGTLLHGRITLLRHQNIDRGSYAVGLHFFELEFPGAKGSLHAILDRIVSVAGLIAWPGNNRMGTNLRMNSPFPQAQPDVPGSVFFVRGETFKLARGLPMFWRTQPSSEEK